MVFPEHAAPATPIRNGLWTAEVDVSAVIGPTLPIADRATRWTGYLYRAAAAGRLCAVAETIELTERERALLDFEGGWWTFDEAKDTLIRARFSCSLDDYYQELNRLLDVPAALTHDPLVVRRLIRLRDRKRRARLDAPAHVDDASGRHNL